MECYRRAMLSEQTFEGRSESLHQANKLSRTHATLVEALNRHRGKASRRSPSSMSTSTPAARPSLSLSPGRGAPPKSEDQPLAKQITHAPGVEMPREIEAERARVPVARGSGI
jgi:hypothetical protein